MYSAVTYDWMPHPGVQAAPAVEPSRTEPAAPASASSASDAPAAPEPQTRRYRWARAIDPYDG